MGECEEGRDRHSTRRAVDVWAMMSKEIRFPPSLALGLSLFLLVSLGMGKNVCVCVLLFSLSLPYVLGGTAAEWR
ncbi:hypothetical protein HOY82DRAFT_556041 [Tuber indicum]|nr:hypothetical protein HOY82DRAFT_556041 [Tuber indicum]